MWQFPHLSQPELDMAYGAAMFHAELVPRFESLKTLSQYSKTLFKNILLAETCKHVQNSFFELHEKEDVIFVCALVCFQLLPSVAQMFHTRFLGIQNNPPKLDCAICLGEGTVANMHHHSHMTTLECQHSFHLECLSQWFMSQSITSACGSSTSSLAWSCPLCRHAFSQL
jgi:hypothetical protein